jgi:hypothetical protein
VWSKDRWRRVGRQRDPQQRGLQRRDLLKGVAILPVAACAQRLEHGPFGVDQDQGWKTVLSTTASELNDLLAAEFDGNPLMEWVEPVQYGFWGAGHASDHPNLQWACEQPLTTDSSIAIEVKGPYNQGWRNRV